MSSNDALELAINAATKALESAQRLHSLESYPESLTRGLGADNDETSIPTVDILSAKSHLLSTYMLELLNMKQLEEQKEEADEEEKERNTGELNKLKFAILKMRPIEKKMEYSIKKIQERGQQYLEKYETTGKLSSSDLSTIQGFEGAGKMVGKDEESGESTDDDDDELDAVRALAKKGGAKSSKTVAVKKSSNNDADENKDKVYRAPRLQAVVDDSQKASKKDKQHARNLERMKNSEIMQGLRQEFTDAPEESGIDGVSGAEGGGLMVNREAGRKIREAEEERKDFEEERFVRLVTGRKEKKEKARLEREGMSINALADLGSFADGVSSFMSEERMEGRGRRGGGGGGNGEEEGQARHVNGKRIRESNHDIAEGTAMKKKGGKGGKGNRLQESLLGGGGGGGKKKVKK
ncbi:hypothetical protein TrLO_g10400 [Triparma laevis f. longispina]|uniref:Uncharacterized protein n=1 Tax=Triparma laevis f. longispina TaxID=1714387 RepID=A0A9W7FMX7_9STRA|nr:hypothetical protein TrLO_g10400 [Triparma laevis f. longispina]